MQAMTLRGACLTGEGLHALMFKRLAEREGDELRCCTHVDAAVALVRDGEVEYVLVDMSIDESAPPNAVERILSAKTGIPIIAVLPENASEAMKEAVFASGVWETLSSPVSAVEFRMRLRSLRLLKRSTSQYRRNELGHADEYRSAVGEILLREFETLYVLGKASEYKDPETGEHIVRVAKYAKLIAAMIGMPEAEREELYHASALHDLGKLGIPDSILVKPGKLDNGEFRIMQAHATIGHAMLSDAKSSFLLAGAMIALTHHERYDGTGYPMMLRGEEIPLYGRIVGIADVFDALTSKRPYKEPWPLENAFAYIGEQRGLQFDPVLADAFLSNAVRVREIFYEHGDIDPVP